MKFFAIAFSAIMALSSFAHAATLTGNDAKHLASILKTAGAVTKKDSKGNEILLAHSVYCFGRNFQDTCLLAPPKDGDNLRFSGEPASALWSLLKKSGIKNQISDLTGSNGESFIVAGNVRCEFSEASNNAVCVADEKE
jgi:hypothetical protein